MKTLIHSFILFFSISGLLTLGLSCDKVVEEPCDDFILHLEEAPLVAFLDPLELVLLYVEGYLEQLKQDPRVLEWHEEYLVYNGLNLLGEPIIIEARIQPVTADEIEVIAYEQTQNFINQLNHNSSPPAETVVPSRSYPKFKCADATTPERSECENNADGSASVHKNYKAKNRCEYTGEKEDLCTKFYLIWYTETAFDDKDCFGGNGNVTSIKQHEEWLPICPG